MDDPTGLQSAVQENLVATTRSITRLAAEDLPFHRSLHPSLGSAIDQQNARILSIAERLLGSAKANVEAVRPSLKDIEDVEDNWNKVVDVIDSLLERADTALDEFTGAVKRLLPKETSDSIANRQKLAASFRNQNIVKPQLHFADKVDNRPTTPFKPLLEHKPHSNIPLQSSPLVNDDTQALYFTQPYQQEIEEYRYPPSLFEIAEPIQYDPFETTSATLVETEEALEEMLEELKSASEIAIDLEHHDTRSYIGIVCLMQISTRERDWVVDTLKPWRRKLQRLNEVFTDPRIVKVLHGAHMDIVWLQRDLGLYIVGLFDTHWASRVLGYPGGSYAYLLKRFTNVDAQKQYQTADWRIRPLPQELLDYARSDTHYLLYIFDHMRNEAIERSGMTDGELPNDKINDILERSREVALQRYEYPVYDLENGQGGTGWYKMLSRTPVMFSKEQFSVFKAVHQWRDDVARDEDESTHFVMPNAQLLSIAHAVPATKDELHDLTSLVSSRSDELLAVIATGKAGAEDGEDMVDALTRIDPIASAKRGTSSRQNGIGSVLSRLGSIKTGGVLAAASSLLPLRTLKSLFWGSAIDQASQKDNQRRGMTTSSSAMQFQAPLPPVSANIFAEGIKTEPEPVAPLTPTAPPNALIEPEDDVFTLRELGRKRKLAETDDADGLAGQTDQIALPDEVADRQAAKAERKKARREAKKAARTAAGDVQVDSEDVEATIDYAAMPSILNQSSSNKAERKHGKKQINPYAKALDAPKGLPRVQKESAGRSMTYAS